jgi:RNA polymerase sigma-70 factor (ECF subfamily)
VHDLFVGLPEALRRYDERGAFAAWLRKITVRMALMRIRSDRRRSELNRAVAADMVEPAAESGIENRTLEDAIQALSPALRTVFLLRTVEGYSHGEIADLLKISTSASEARLSRAIAALRASLKEYRRWS